MARTAIPSARAAAVKTAIVFVQNLFTYSEQQNHANWILTGAAGSVVITADTTVAPDGTTTADTATPNTASTSHGKYQAFTYGPNAYSFSIFAKAGTYGFLTLDLKNAGTLGATFNLNTGVVGYTDTGITATIVPAATGYYRCTITGTPGAGLNYPEWYFSSTGTTNGRSWTPVGTETMILWGAQLVQANWAGVYVQTVASTVNTGDIRKIYPSVQNLFTYSRQRNNAAWTKGSTTVTANADAAQDGTLTADRLYESATSTTHYITETPSPAFSVEQVTYTETVKDGGGRSWLALSIDGGVTFAFFDFTNGVLGTVNARYTAKITPNLQGNGFYDCSITSLLTAAVSPALFLSTDGSTLNYLGDVTKYIVLGDSRIVRANWKGPATVDTAAATINTGGIRNIV